MDDIKPEDLQLQVIRIEQLHPRDFIIVKHNPVQVSSEKVKRWADEFFKGFRVGIVPKGVEIEVIKEQVAPDAI